MAAYKSKKAIQAHLKQSRFFVNFQKSFIVDDYFWDYPYQLLSFFVSSIKVSFLCSANVVYMLFVNNE